MRSRCKIVFFSGVLIAFCAAALTACGTGGIKDTDTVMEINGQSVVKGEYQMILSEYESQVKSQYTTEEANRSDFWTTTFDGKEPLKQIIELAKEDCVQKKVIAQMAKDYGIETETDYISITEQMREINKARESGTSPESPVYGLSAFSLNDYYEYVYSGVEANLLECLKKEQRMSDESLRQFYEENKEDYTSDVSVCMLIAEMSMQTGSEYANQIAQEMVADCDKEGLSEKYPDVSFYELSMSSLNTEEGKSGVYAARWMLASGMQAGETSEPFQVGDHMMVMRCLKRSEHEVQPFEEVKGALESSVLTGMAKDKIEINKKGAKISFDEDDLKKVALEILVN